MNKIISLLLIVFLISCNTKNTEKKVQTPTLTKEVKKDSVVKQVKPVKIVKKITPESKLKGQFKFGLSQADKRKFSPSSRAYIVRSSVVDNVNIKITFYGNGKGVYFWDNGKYEYMTKKMIDEASFEYKIIKNKIMIKEYNQQKFKLIGTIKDESINKDYFDINLVGENDMTFGMYKIGNSPK